MWPQTSAAAQLGAFYLGPAAAMTAAWAAGRAARSSFDAQLATTARWRIELVLLVSTLAWFLATYAIGFAAAAVASQHSGGPGWLWPSYFLLGVAVVCGCAGFGHLVGRWTDGGFIAPIAAGLICFVFLAYTGHRSDLFELTGPPDVVLRPVGVLARLFTAAAVCVFAVVVPRPNPRTRVLGFGRRGGFGAAPVLAAFVLVLVAFGVLRSAPPLLGFRAAPALPVCSETDAPQVCVWPDETKYLPELEQLTKRIDQLPSGLFISPARFWEQGLRPPSYFSDGTPVYTDDFYINEGSMWDVGIAMSGTILQRTLGHFCTLTSDAAEGRRAVVLGELSMWLTARLTGAGRPGDMHGGPDGVDVDAVSRVAEQGDGYQRAWVTKRLEEVRHAPCA